MDYYISDCVCVCVCVGGGGGGGGPELTGMQFPIKSSLLKKRVLQHGVLLNRRCNNNFNTPGVKIFIYGLLYQVTVCGVCVCGGGGGWS